jgi:hypothetical protein
VLDTVVTGRYVYVKHERTTMTKAKETKRTAAPRSTKATTTPPTKRYDWNSREGRVALRLAILKEMAKPPIVALPRGIIASGIGIGNSENALRAVTAGLRMLDASGHVDHDGEGPRRQYKITVTGIEAVKEGGGK